MLASPWAPVFGWTFNKVKVRLHIRTKGIIASCLRCSYGYWIDYVRPPGLPHSLCSGVRAKRRCSGVMMAVTLQVSYMNKMYAVHEGGQRTARTTKSLSKKSARNRLDNEMLWLITIQ